MVGDRDGECPAPQSFEFWHALHDLHVPARLVVYPNEGHGFSDPAHILDVQQRASDWFARYIHESRDQGTKEQGNKGTRKSGPAAVPEKRTA